jgi:hypothetical protein
MVTHPPYGGGQNPAYRPAHRHIRIAVSLRFAVIPVGAFRWNSRASPSTPVAIVERGGTPHERRQLTELDPLGDTEVAAPAVIVVGAVVALMRPLIFGRRRRTPSAPEIAHHNVSTLA